MAGPNQSASGLLLNKSRGIQVQSTPITCIRIIWNPETLFFGLAFFVYTYKRRFLAPKTQVFKRKVSVEILENAGFLFTFGLTKTEVLDRIMKYIIYH